MKAPFKLPFGERTITSIVVIPSAIIVIALGMLQYRWSTRISEATAVRLADSLQMSLMNWQKDFFRYFAEIGQALRIDPIEDAPGDVHQYVRRLDEWKAVTKYPELVSNVYILRAEAAAQSAALQLNSSAREFEPAAWPVEFEELRPDLRRAAAKVLTSRQQKTGMPQQASSEGSGRQRAYGYSAIGDGSGGWWFEPEIPALLHPILLEPGQNRTPESVDWMVITLNQQEIQTRVLAELSQTYFQGTDGLDYEVAVIAETKPGHILYTSDKGFGYPDPSDADGIIDIFGRIRDRALSSPVHVFHMPSDNKGPSDLVKISWFPLLRPVAEDLDWRVVVRHRRGGPLGAFVAEMHRRDLAIGFGVLLVLVVNMAMLIVTSHRAQRLAQLQMTFVTAVSHELRTPLSVIISGAENICNGVVGTPQQMKQYGAVIGTQARSLVALVERILLFASTRQGRQTYNLIPLQVDEVLDEALADAAGMIEEAQFTVECSTEPGLPQIVGDAAALSQCLQNLITNALKYGKEQHWLGIRVTLDEAGPTGEEIRISVADRGIGISPEELPHIFEPFYRSPTVRLAQIHGTGLGLPLSKSLVEAMNGRITVVSKSGHGSTFTLHLPCIKPSIGTITA